MLCEYYHPAFICRNCRDQSCMHTYRILSGIWTPCIHNLVPWTCRLICVSFPFEVSHTNGCAQWGRVEWHAHKKWEGGEVRITYTQSEKRRRDRITAQKVQTERYMHKGTVLSSPRYILSDQKWQTLVSEKDFPGTMFVETKVGYSLPLTFYHPVSPWIWAVCHICGRLPLFCLCEN